MSYICLLIYIWKPSLPDVLSFLSIFVSVYLYEIAFKDKFRTKK